MPSEGTPGLCQSTVPPGCASARQGRSLRGVFKNVFASDHAHRDGLHEEQTIRHQVARLILAGRRFVTLSQPQWRASLLHGAA